MDNPITIELCQPDDRYGLMPSFQMALPAEPLELFDLMHKGHFDNPALAYTVDFVGTNYELDFEGIGEKDP